MDVSLLPITFQSLLKMLHGQGKFYLVTIHQSKMIMQIDIFLLQLKGLPKWFLSLLPAIRLPESQRQFDFGPEKRRIDHQSLLKVLDGPVDLASVPQQQPIMIKQLRLIRIFLYLSAVTLHLNFQHIILVNYVSLAGIVPIRVFPSILPQLRSLELQSVHFHKKQIGVRL